MQQIQHPVAEIMVSRSRESGLYGYSVHVIGSPELHCCGGFASATEVVWRALDAIREDDARSGIVAIYSHDGHHVALAPLWAVPTYELLEWIPRATALDLRSIDLSPLFSDREPTHPGTGDAS